MNCEECGHSLSVHRPFCCIGDCVSCSFFHECADINYGRFEDKNGTTTCLGEQNPDIDFEQIHRKYNKEESE